MEGNGKKSGKAGAEDSKEMIDPTNGPVSSRSAIYEDELVGNEELDPTEDTPLIQ